MSEPEPTLRAHLPWPDNRLSPNARKDRRGISDVRQRYRHACGMIVREIAGRSARISAPALHVRLTFYPPDNRARDMDNMLASIKSGLDGVADQIGIDDSKWGYSLRRGVQVKGGSVLVELFEREEVDAWELVA